MTSRTASTSSSSRTRWPNSSALYSEKTVEIPLYYRKQVDLHAPRLGNFFANPTQAGPNWNVVDWFVTS